MLKNIGVILIADKKVTVVQKKQSEKMCDNGIELFFMEQVMLNPPKCGRVLVWVLPAGLHGEADNALFNKKGPGQQRQI